MEPQAAKREMGHTLSNTTPDFGSVSRGSYAAIQTKWSASESSWSWTRLGIFGLVIAAWGIWWREPLIPGIISAAGMGLFSLAVRRHQFARDRREQADRLLLMAEESGQRGQGAIALIRKADRPEQDASFDAALPADRDEGPAWELTDQERDDLDLFARPVGIFGLLNRTSTAAGARRLARLLDRPLLSPGDIERRQAAVRMLAEDDSLRDQVMAGCAALRNEDKRLAKFVAAIAGCAPLRLFAAIPILRGWSLISAALLVTSLMLVFMGHLAWATLGGAVFTVNFILYLRMHASLREAIDPWIDVSWAVRGMRIASQIGARKLPGDHALGEIRAAFERVATPDGLPRIEKRIGWAETGGGMHFLFNTIVFYDLHIAASLMNCVTPRKAELLAAIAALGRLEALCSLACFAAEQPVRCYPDFSNDQDVRLIGGIHPLVPPNQVIDNDLEFTATARMRVVTGSNMAGKSTYLRMVGVNILLAQIGTTPTASALSMPPLRLISDLRARDNLAQRESYFLSEVRHLKRMILAPSGHQRILGLIDEPFRGTNSQDQTAASVAVVRHLMASGHYFLLATHDRHLTGLADGLCVRNYHFQENLGRDGMVFDYKLHDGPATTRNALRILEREGYPPTLLRDAHEWLSQYVEPHGPQLVEPVSTTDVRQSS